MCTGELFNTIAHNSLVYCYKQPKDLNIAEVSRLPEPHELIPWSQKILSMHTTSSVFRCLEYCNYYRKGT